MLMTERDEQGHVKYPLPPEAIPFILAALESLYWQLGKPLNLDNIVFTSVKDEPIAPGVLTHNFSRLCKHGIYNGHIFSYN